MLLQIDKKQIEPDITILEFTGKISLGRESQRIETMVNELLAQKISKLIFDLSRVDYIDSAGLGIMTYCYGAMKTAGGTFRLAGANGRVGLVNQPDDLARRARESWRRSPARSP